MSDARSRNLVVAGLAALSMFVSACSSDDDPASDQVTGQSPADDSATPRSYLVGPGCREYASQVPDGAGSLEGMAQDPVATAASNNPLLKTMTAAISGKLNKDVDLVDTLNGDEFTVFAPVDEAFAKLPEETVETLGTPEGAKALEKLLTYHVVAGRLAPDEVPGTHETENGADVTVKGEAHAITVGEGNAQVICGGIRTANATVYLIDSVLMPPG